MPTRRELLVQFAASIGVALAAGCHDKDPGAAAGADPRSLPLLEFDEDTPELLLTFIDERGETHVVQRPSAVPGTSAAYVRVDLAEAPRAPGAVYVSDLTEGSGAGHYTAHGVPRADWEAEIERRRKERPAVAAAPPRREARPRDPAPRDPVAPEGHPSPEGPAAPGEAPRGGEGAEGQAVIVYGAPWCGACSQARKYLQSKGVSAQFKDIDSDGAARVQMDAKLTKHGLRKGSIPVIDVRGRVMVGFSASKIDEALRATSTRATPDGTKM